MLKTKRLPIAAALTLALLSMEAVAQTVPDAGALRQQIERNRETSLPNLAQPAQPASPAALVPQSGVIVTVKQFRLAGNTLLSSEQLQSVLTPYLNRPLDYMQLQAAATALGEYYRAAGWIVRTYLPQQEIAEGVVTIQIVEAVFSGVKIEGDVPSRVKLSSILALFNAQQKVGQPLSANALDRALLLCGDLPGINVVGNLREGSRDGETELVLTLSEKPLVFGQAGLDNTASRSTGESRATLSANLASPLGLADAVDFSAIGTRGSQYYAIGYSLPVGNQGARVSLNTSHMDYHLTASEFAALNGTGFSDTNALQVSYPVLRTRTQNLYASVDFASKTFHNEARGAVQSNYTDELLTLGLSGNLFDSLGGGGANTASIYWGRGNLNQGTLDPGEIPGFGGGFEKLSYSLSRQQTITQDLSLFTALSGQQASKDLDTSERLYLGGASGVRAYPTNEASGSKGQLLNLELRQRLPGNFVVSGFYDWGTVSNSSSVGRSYALKGFGLGLSWSAMSGASIKLVWARRDGDNPNPSANGADQDGSLVRDRFWLTLTVPFGYSPQRARTTTVATTDEQTKVLSQASAPIAPAPDAGVTNAPSALSSTLEVAAPVADSSAFKSNEAVSSEDSSVLSMLDAWLQAWARADVKAYLAFYADDFQPVCGLTPLRWKAQRVSRLKYAGNINIMAQDIVVQVSGITATVHFVQHYQAKHHTDTVKKTLQLRRVEGAWRIVNESAKR